MKRIVNLLLVMCLFAVTISACSDQNTDIALEEEVSEAVLDKIAAAGFSPENVFKTTWNGQDGYVVEYDLFFTEQAINDLAGGINVANTEHYHTTNLVSSLPRAIKIAIDPAFSQNVKSALQATIDMYNAENLQISFVETTATVTVTGRGRRQTITVDTDADIFISSFSERPRRGLITVGIAAGFPTDQGDPANGFGLNTYWIDNNNPSVSDIAGVMAHEIGHCIGFRHTDYTTRDSCPAASQGNEGDAGVGAIYIPGTPSGSDATSLMQACGPADVFNENDRIALDYLY